MVANALKFDLQEVDHVYAQLRTAGLVDSDGTLTAFGGSELALGRTVVSAATSRIVDGIDDDERMITRRVLVHLRLKADELLRS